MSSSITNLSAALVCLVVFHSPDGKELRLDNRHISAVRTAENAKQYVTAGVNTIIYVGGEKFGIMETPTEAEYLMRHCVEEEE